MCDHDVRNSALVRLVNQQVTFFSRNVSGLQYQVVMLRDEIDQLKHAGQQMAIFGNAHKWSLSVRFLYDVLGIERGQPDDPAPAALHGRHVLHRFQIDSADGQVLGNASE